MPLFKKKDQEKLISLAEKSIFKAEEAEDLDGAGKFSEALDQFVAAADDAFDWRDILGVPAGTVVEAIDGPIIRFVGGALLQKAFDALRESGRI